MVGVARSSSTSSTTATKRPTPRATATSTPHSAYLEDYHILQTTKDEYIIGQIRRDLEAAGVPVEFSKGEAGQGQHEINLDYTTAVEMADRNTVYKNAAKEIAALNGRSISFMAKYGFDETGSSCHIHSSLWSDDGPEPAMDDDHGEHGMSELFRWYLGGLLATRGRVLVAVGADDQQLQAVPARLVGADGRSAGASTTARSASARSVTATAPGSSAASRVATPTATSRSPARSPAACTASATGSSRRPPYVGNGYDATDLPRIPWNIVDAIDLWESSAVAKEAFGDDVHHHILNCAKPGVGGVQPARHRLGAPSLLGTDLSAKGVGVRACETMNRCERQPARSRRRHRRPARRAPCALRRRSPTGVRLPAAPLRQ